MGQGAAYFIDAAARIGRALCRTAYWHDGQCNWLGRSSREMVRPGVPVIPTVAALGPDLYAGTAGIALFLAELNRQAPAPAVSRTARGAMRQALAQEGAVPAATKVSFYSGSIGIAYASARVGLLLDDPELVRSGLDLARGAAAPDDTQPLDVVGGNAGAIAPLLWLAKLADDDRLEHVALDLATHLADRATKSKGGGWCWETDVASGKGMGPTPLCGYAHGASGMGLALIEIGTRHGRRDWVEGGIAAFAYEDRLFDAEARNWPDLREMHKQGEGQREAGRSAFMIAWCHGAAGIGLARLRAYEKLPEQRAYLLPAIEQAIDATRTYLRRMPVEADVSPCHGRSGLIELILYADEVLGRPALRVEAIEAWRAPLRRQRNMDWPCGVASGRNNPSLMLGYAGIGYGLLRTSAGEKLRSTLVIDPDS